MYEKAARRGLPRGPADRLARQAIAVCPGQFLTSRAVPRMTIAAAAGMMHTIATIAAYRSTLDGGPSDMGSQGIRCFFCSNCRGWRLAGWGCILTS